MIYKMLHTKLKFDERAFNTGSDVSHVTPKGVPLGGRMRNQKLGLAALFSGVFGYVV
jgi:hypothetical protein